MKSTPEKAAPTHMLPLINSSYFKDLLESFNYGVVIFNINDTAYAANSLAGDMLECEQEAILGKGWREVFAGLQNQGAIETFMGNALIGDVERISVDTRRVAADGDVRHLTLSGALLIENDKIFGILVSISDISHIIELHEREKQILAEKTALQKERAESMVQLAKTFVHQIRNPIMSLGGFANLLSRAPELTERSRNFSQVIVDEAKKLEQIVTAFSTFSGVRAGKREALNLENFLQNARALAEQYARELQVDVAWELDSSRCGSCLVETDPEMLMQAVQALLRNALEAFENGVGGVILQAERSSAGWTLQIMDDGPGILKEHEPYLFDPFFSTKAQNVGMGLSIARRIVEELGGELQVHSLAPRGVKVEFIFTR